MSKRKSIVSAFGDFRSDHKAEETAADAALEDTKSKPKRVAAGIIGTTQRTLTQIREERDALLKQAIDNNQVLELDPQLIDPSPYRDRLPDDDSQNFEHFKASISEEGQKVPITVRRHSEIPERFQVVYGHRRLRALRELGQSVLAIVTDYTDRDLVIAQGIENASRQDLSWIEKALFADEMQNAGIKPRDIKAALGIDDAELSKLRTVLKALPSDVVERIGRAPAIGRPRWLELASNASSKDAIAMIRKTLSDDKVLQSTSDQRFLAALSSSTSNGREPRKAQERISRDLGGVGSMIVTAKAVKITLDKKHGEGFSKFLEAEMESLLERYKRSLRE